MLNIVTHNKLFHADEVSAIALLSIFVDADVEVERVEHNSSSFEKYDMVVDISRQFDGVKFFDHHQYRGGKSSAGLIWEYIGLEKKYPSISQLIKIVDEQDVGIKKAGDFEFPNLIRVYNHLDVDSQEQEGQFEKALEFAKSIFSSLKIKDEEIVKAKEIVTNSFLFDANPSILELETFTPYWGSYINSQATPNVKLVVWEDKRDGSYKVRVVTNKRKQIMLKEDANMEFVHSAGFFAVAKDEEMMQEYLRKIKL